MSADPDLALLKIKIHHAEYWDRHSASMVQLIGYVKASLTGQSYQPNADE